MMAPGTGQGSAALEAPYVQAYIQSGEEARHDSAPAFGVLRLTAQAVGAALSVAVLCAGGWWGYQQIMRDVHGVPVVKALDGPLRIAPEEPGGSVATHAGFSVNTVQSVGTAASPETQMTLAPDPVALESEDLPTASLKPLARPKPPVPAASAELAQASPETQEDTLGRIAQAEADDAELVSPAPVTPAPASLNVEVPAEDPMTRAAELADAVAADATPLDGAELDGAETETEAQAQAEPSAAQTDRAGQIAAIEAAVQTAAVVVPQSLIGDAPGLSASPRPARRPGAAGPASTLVSAPAAPQEIAAAPAPVLSLGSEQVHLGSYSSSAEADAAWSRLNGQFAGLLVGKSPAVLEGQSGDARYWRLRATGFADLAEARTFCNTLMAQQAECVPVVTR